MMKKQALFALLFCFLLTPVLSEDITPKSVQAGTNMELVNPGPVKPGEYAYVQLKGITLQQIEQAMEESRFDVTAYPLKGVRVKSSYDFLFKRLELMLKADKPGTYLLKLHMIEDGKFKIAATEVIVEGSEPDPPDPDPTPDPTPGPKQVCFVMESQRLSTLPRSQQTLLASLSLRTELKKAGHTFIGNLDPQAYGVDCSTGVCVSDSTQYEKWLTAAKGKPLPVLLVSTPGSGVIETYPLPTDTEGLWEIIGRKP